jgi:hypothetical protein
MQNAMCSLHAGRDVTTGVYIRLSAIDVACQLERSYCSSLKTSAQLQPNLLHVHKESPFSQNSFYLQIIISCIVGLK